MPFLSDPAPVTLSGQLVSLRPLSLDDHDALVDAVQDGNLAENSWYTLIPSVAGMRAEIENRLVLAEKGEMVTFVAADATGRVIGMTSYYDIDPIVPRLHIGYTWNRASAHASGTNAESKYLLLKHAFETLGTFRVGFATQWLNFQSRAAIERLGAKQDGVLRAITRYTSNGALRDTVEYSILEPEWPAVKAGLEARLKRRGVTFD